MPSGRNSDEKATKRRVVLGTFHGGISHKHLPAYLNDFEFRFNRRNSASRWLLF